LGLEGGEAGRSWLLRLSSTQVVLSLEITRKGKKAGEGELLRAKEKALLSLFEGDETTLGPSAQEQKKPFKAKVLVCFSRPRRRAES